MDKRKLDHAIPDETLMQSQAGGDELDDIYTRVNVRVREVVCDSSTPFLHLLKCLALLPYQP